MRKVLHTARITQLTRSGHNLQLAISAISVNSKDFADFNSGAIAERLVGSTELGGGAMGSGLGSRREKD